MTYPARLAAPAPAVQATVVAGAVSAGTRLPALDVGYMLRGYFYAYSPQRDDRFGGHARSSNLPRALAGAGLPPTTQVSLLVLRDQPRPFAPGNDGFRVVLVNPTGQGLEVPASDSRLPIVHEARDPSGAWRAIEYLPSSWCGNSRHTLTLPPGQYWEFTAPRYTGTLATEVRLVLSFDSDTGTTVVRSAPFPGRINPAQFTVKQGHEARSVMDPYDE
ncbi:MAG: hypothetical protein KBG28_26880 [Kofleriaceae bacterium]|nr:hypothetical protein [Kofleriaceae bacterium]MBP6837062.1 hypothetical protein [Kofleriaceae bacterium]MBP9207619.1 hypothetical protein [Kofleriaceae bacterium]